MTDQTDTVNAWPFRAPVLALLGAAIGLAADALLFESGSPDWQETQNVLRISAAGFLIVAGILFGVTAERSRWLWSAAFAVAGGIVVASILQWNGSPSGWNAGEQWHLVAAFIAIVLAAPLFQSARDAGAAQTDPAGFHHHAWANVILWFAAWGFVLIAFLLTHLLAALFGLVGIELPSRLMRESWFVAALIGGSFGTAVGLLREQGRLLGTIQRAALAILAVLAPVLALGLALFILALPFTGLAPLWEQTKATTPILLTCVIGAIVLANAVIGEEAERRRPLHIAAMVLAAVMLPLAIVAAVSTGLRIDQHGLTPDRLWGLTFVVALTAIAVAYAVALLRPKLFALRVNFVNIRLAIGLTIAALLLATPLAGFGAFSTRNQLARLESGVVAPDKFDWLAMRFDFGPSGRAALERLVRAEAGPIRTYARNTLARENRFGDLESRTAALVVIPARAAAPADLVRLATAFCGGAGDCLLHWRPGQRQAIAILDGCRSFARAEVPGDTCGTTVAVFEQAEGAWRDVRNRPPRAPQAVPVRSSVEIRAVPRRQVFIDGRPVGEPFE